MIEQRRQRALGQTKTVHMVGIGGIGMSSIAEVLLLRGYQVTGSDLEESAITRRLESLGAGIRYDHVADHVGHADVVVYSSAVQPEVNPETLEAERRRIPLIRRDEMLAELMRMKYGVAIAGTHGKTTTTSLVGLVAQGGGCEPTVVVGGRVAEFGSNAVTGEGDLIVIEADEYDRTFLRLTPVLAVITNIEEEHLDTYRDFDDIKSAFVQFANSVPFFGSVIVCLDDPVVQECLCRIDRPVFTYGLSRQASVRGEDIRQEGLRISFAVVHDGNDLGRIDLKLPGLHNVRNALAAVAVGIELDIPFETIRRSLASFTGVFRRFEIRAEFGGVTVVDDYAHHPTEIRATLKTATEVWPDRRIVAVFQPHLFSRTKRFLTEFASSFFDANVLVVTDIYPARERPIPDIHGGMVADLAVQNGHRQVHYVPDKNDLPGSLSGIVRSGDVVIMLGAGDIWRASERFVETMQADANHE